MHKFGKINRACSFFPWYCKDEEVVNSATITKKIQCYWRTTKQHKLILNTHQIILTYQAALKTWPWFQKPSKKISPSNSEVD